MIFFVLANVSRERCLKLRQRPKSWVPLSETQQRKQQQQQTEKEEDPVTELFAHLMELPLSKSDILTNEKVGGWGERNQNKFYL